MSMRKIELFVPPEFGFRGVLSGASMVFFAFVGFDTVATLAEETKKRAEIYDWYIRVTYYLWLFVLLDGISNYWHGALYGHKCGCAVRRCVR